MTTPYFTKIATTSGRLAKKYFLLSAPEGVFARTATKPRPPSGAPEGGSSRGFDRCCASCKGPDLCGETRLGQNPESFPEHKILFQQPARACVAIALAVLLSLPTSADASYRDRHSVQRAEVISVNPLYEAVEVREPREQCRVVPVRERSRLAYPYGYSNDQARRSRTPAVVGAILGGAIGHSVGHGKKNKRIGTAVGAILGGTIGGDISRRNHDLRNHHLRNHHLRNQKPHNHEGSRDVRYRTERVCEVVAKVRTEERISGYDVDYAYGGETYSTVLDYDPGRYLEVNVSVTRSFHRSLSPRSLNEWVTIG